jgi:hypothetical protein
MAKPSKYNRARIRSRARRPRQRGGSRMWLFATVAVIVVGVALVVVSRSDRQGASAVSPKIGEHFHAYLGVNVCGEWITNAPQFEQRANETGITAGLHSHGDGLMHLHPFATDEAGENATVGRFFDYGGWKVSSDELETWVGGTHRNGQECTGKTPGKGEVQWVVGRHNQPWPTEARTGDPADYRPRNGDIVALYFVPKGTKLEEPPGANAALDNIEDLGGQPATPQTPSGSTPVPSTPAPSTPVSSTPPSSTP